MPEVTDAALVARVRLGDRFAEHAIFQRYASHLYGVCLRLLRDHEEAQDVVQDSFVDMLEQLESLRAPAQLRTWLTAIAVHKVHRRFRRRRLLRVLGLARGQAPELDALPARNDLGPELCAELARLDRALAATPERARAAWVLRHVEGYRLEEVAELCRCSLATAKRRIAEVDRAVRAHVEFEESVP